MSFAHFHEQGFTIPAHPFLQGLLDYYQVELQHLTPNGIQHIMAFVALCEGFLRISPHFDLWRYLFAVNLLKRRAGSCTHWWGAPASTSAATGQERTR